MNEGFGGDYFAGELCVGASFVNFYFGDVAIGTVGLEDADKSVRIGCGKCPRGGSKFKPSGGWFCGVGGRQAGEGGDGNRVESVAGERRIGGAQGASTRFLDGNKAACGVVGEMEIVALRIGNARHEVVFCVAGGEG